MNKKDYRDILEWACVLVVFTAMMAYGLGKIVQFNYEMYADKTLMELTPMQLMWAFYGYSLTHAILLGLVEVLGGLMLLFRQSRVFGAMILSGVLSYVIFQDIVYEVLRGALFAAIIYLLLVQIILYLNRDKVIEIVKSLLDKRIQEKSSMNIFLKIFMIIILAGIIKFLEIQITHKNILNF
ncbi:MAG: hypothetical protein IAE65_01850 [Ignavibacteria bacterium]|nr:hypothetical protein [Ignavibacteria bacterium]